MASSKGSFRRALRVRESKSANSQRDWTRKPDNRQTLNVQLTVRLISDIIKECAASSAAIRYRVKMIRHYKLVS